MDWHERYIQQAGWTAQLRAFLFKQAGVYTARRILDVGCGTGALLEDFGVKPGLYGLDIDQAALTRAGEYAPAARLTCADAAGLPFAPGVFDAVFCHFTLLWLKDPARALAEMRRVTRTGGAVLALAEPDYGGRVDYPVELADLGRWQSSALLSQGADPKMGRRLAALFSQAGFRDVQTGVLGGQWQGPPPAEALKLEWETIASDLSGQIPSAQLEQMRLLDEKAWRRGERVLFVPTFYAWGVA